MIRKEDGGNGEWDLRPGTFQTCTLSPGKRTQRETTILFFCAFPLSNVLYLMKRGIFSWNYYGTSHS